MFFLRRKRMSTSIPRGILEAKYFQEAQAYLRSLPPEHFMEARKQATQRKIFVECLDLVHEADPRVQSFNEMLVQYDRPKHKKPGQVVPDNMVVVHSEPIDAETSYDVPLQPVPPFWVLEYVSKSSKRKDYEKSMAKYEHELKVPYYLVFYPDTQDMTLYHHDGERYHSVKPNENDRVEIPELTMEMGLLDGWVRFWFRGELLPLPADLQRELDQTRVQLKKAQQRANKAEQRANKAEQQLAEDRQARLDLEQQLAQLKARLAQLPEQPATPQ